VAVAVVLGLLLAIRAWQGPPPSTSWAEVSGPRESAQASAGPGDQIHTARPGDTFWSLASELAPGDPRPVVDALVAANGGSSALVVGQQVIIPAGVLEPPPE
jgi:Tfp pilus assembly protein FimV